MSSRNAPVTRIEEAWGYVAEHLAADQKLVDAVGFILGFEQDRVDVKHIAGVPCDIAYPEVANRLGVVEGLAVAISALTDSAYIAARRDDLASKEKKQDE
jgi:hypothetical protein